MLEIQSISSDRIGTGSLLVVIVLCAADATGTKVEVTTGTVVTLDAGIVISPCDGP
jgi:hypothetical protein